MSIVSFYLLQDCLTLVFLKNALWYHIYYKYSLNKCFKIYDLPGICNLENCHKHVFLFISLTNNCIFTKIRCILYLTFGRKAVTMK